MVASDFFSFDENEYAARISQYDNERLYKQEIVKTRQQGSACWSIGSGIGGAFFSFGGTLLVSGYGLRRRYVAEKKQALLKSELRKRGIDPHKFSKRDFFIPLGAGVVCLGMGFGLESVACEATNTLAAGVQVPSGGSALQSVISDPGDALHGLVGGIEEQANEVGFAAHGLEAGIIPGSEQSAEALAAATQWATTDNAAMAVGYHAGMLLAQAVEKGVVGVVAAQCAWSIMESFESYKHVPAAGSCKRILGSWFSQCDQCQKAITTGQFWHCCLCMDDNYDICQDCYAAGNRCKSTKKHVMKSLQVAMDSDYIADESILRQYPLQEPVRLGREHPSTEVRKAIFRCDGCAKSTRQGRWFHCPDCDDFDLCSTCYIGGKRCAGAKHRLEARLCAINCFGNPYAVSSCKRPLVKQTSCDACQAKVTQGRFYHCCDCNEDSFDLCHSCYKSGHKCKNPEAHTLRKHLVGTHQPDGLWPSTCGRELSPDNMKNGGSCSRCKGQFRKSQVFYHCCTCDGDNFDICSNCYGEGKGCNDPKHQLSLHII